MDWHLSAEHALMDLVFWFIVACFGIGAAMILWDVFRGDRNE